MTEDTNEELKDDPIVTLILEALADGGPKSPERVASHVAAGKKSPGGKEKHWRQYFQAVKQQALHLARNGRLEIVRKGKVVDPNDFKGIVRFRLPRNAKQSRAAQTED